MNLYGICLDRFFLFWVSLFNAVPLHSFKYNSQRLNRLYRELVFVTRCSMLNPFSPGKCLSYFNDFYWWNYFDKRVSIESVSLSFFAVLSVIFWTWIWLRVYQTRVNKNDITNPKRVRAQLYKGSLAFFWSHQLMVAKMNGRAGAKKKQKKRTIVMSC